MDSVIKNQNKLVLLKEETDILKCVMVNSDTQKVSSVTTLDGNKTKQFVEDISNLFKEEAKAVFLCISEYCPPGFSSCYEFRKELKQKFDNLKIPYYFFDVLQWFYSSRLISVNYASEVDDVILLIDASDGKVSIIACKFTQNGYLLSRPNLLTMNKSDTEIREQIVKQADPKALFFLDNASNGERLKNIFMSKKIFIFEEEMDSAMPKILNELSKWFFDRSIVKYHICPVTFDKVTVSAKIGDVEYPLVCFDEHMILPLSTTKTFKKIVNICSLSVKEQDVDRPKILASWLPDQKVHRHEVTLSIDDQGFIDYAVKPVFWQHVKLLPMLLENRIKCEIPVIAFAENLSFICVRKNAKSEYGMDLFISFNEEKAKYCQNALEAARTKPTFVVHNVFTMLITPPEDIKKFPIVAFEMTEDEKNPILVEFDNYDGTRKAATPQFLMAMLLKQHLKAIKAETGEKPMKLAFTTFADLDEDELNRFKNKLTEACEMLKISCEFIAPNYVF